LQEQACVIQVLDELAGNDHVEATKSAGDLVEVLGIAMMDVVPVTMTLYLQNGIGGKVDADQLGGHLSKRAV
jgi:hypothetical protein